MQFTNLLLASKDIQVRSDITLVDSLYVIFVAQKKGTKETSLESSPM